MGSYTKAIRQNGCPHKPLLFIDFIRKACFLVHGAPRTGFICPHLTFLFFPSFSSLSWESWQCSGCLPRGLRNFTSCQLIKPHRTKTLFVVKSTLFFLIYIFSYSAQLKQTSWATQMMSRSHLVGEEHPQQQQEVDCNLLSLMKSYSRGVGWGGCRVFSISPSCSVGSHCRRWCWILIMAREGKSSFHPVSLYSFFEAVTMHEMERSE